MAVKDLNLKQQAYDYLKTRILDCDIKPGEYINEKEILETLEIGRTPFREAIIMLQAEHLVEVRPRHGTYATKLTREDVIEVFTMRKMFEPVAVFTYLNRIDFSKLLENDSKMEQLAKRAVEVHPSVLCATDMDFHASFIESSENTRLVRLFKPVFQDAYRISMFNNWATNTEGQTWKDTYEQHHSILQAIFAQDQQEIIRTYNTHLNHYLGSALATIDAYEQDRSEI